MSVPDETRTPAAPALVGSATLATIKPLSYPAGTVLFRPGERDDVLYIVLSGAIGLVHEHDDSHEPNEHVFGPEAILGGMALFGPESITHRFTGRALGDLQVLVVPREQIDALAQREPVVAYRLLHLATNFMRHAERDAMREMEAKNEQLEQAYDALRTAQAQLLGHERLQHELHLARELQEQMLPSTLPRVPGIDVGARLIPAREVSGDFFDLFMLDDETLGVMIGDVCGKGMPAALYMAQSRSLLRAAARLPEPPEAVLRIVNNLLLEMNSGTMFVTCILLRLHVRTRTLLVARAGHEIPLVCRSGGVPQLIPDAVGQPLGILKEPAIDVHSLVLDPGDTLLLYTDGVTEAVNPAAVFFGIDRLLSVVRTSSATTAQGLCELIVEQLLAYQATVPLGDDVTMVALRAM